jgi:hypothetical protein
VLAAQAEAKKRRNISMEGKDKKLAENKSVY